MPEAKKLLDLDGVLGAFEGLSEDPEKPGKKRLRVDDALQAFDAIAAPEPPTPEEEEEPTGLRRKLPPRAGLFTAMFPEDELREKRQPLLGQIGERFVQGLVRNPVFPPEKDQTPAEFHQERVDAIKGWFGKGPKPEDAGEPIPAHRPVSETPEVSPVPAHRPEVALRGVVEDARLREEAPEVLPLEDEELDRLSYRASINEELNQLVADLQKVDRTQPLPEAKEAEFAQRVLALKEKIEEDDGDDEWHMRPRLEKTIDAIGALQNLRTADDVPLVRPLSSQPWVDSPYIGAALTRGTYRTLSGALRTMAEVMPTKSPYVRATAIGLADAMSRRAGRVPVDRATLIKELEQTLAEAEDKGQIKAFLQSLAQEPAATLKALTGEIAETVPMSATGIAVAGMTRGVGLPSFIQGLAVIGSVAPLEIGAQLEEAVFDPTTGISRPISDKARNAAITSGLAASVFEAFSDLKLFDNLAGAIAKAPLKEGVKQEMRSEMKDRFIQILARSGTQATVEGTTEAIQGAIADVGAQYGWDESRVVGERMFNEFLVGAIFGGGMVATPATVSAAMESLERKVLAYQAKAVLNLAEGMAQEEGLSVVEESDRLPQPAQPEGEPDVQPEEIGAVEPAAEPVVGEEPAAEPRPAEDAEIDEVVEPPAGEAVVEEDGGVPELPGVTEPVSGVDEEAVPGTVEAGERGELGRSFDGFPIRFETEGDVQPTDTPPQRTSNGDFVLYHGTSSTAADKILRSGTLKADNLGAVGFGIDEGDAAVYGSMKSLQGAGGSVVLKVVLDKDWLATQPDSITREQRNTWELDLSGQSEIPISAIKSIEVVRGEATPTEETTPVEPFLRVDEETTRVRVAGQNYKRVAGAQGVQWFAHPEGDNVRWVPAENEAELEASYVAQVLGTPVQPETPLSPERVSISDDIAKAARGFVFTSPQTREDMGFDEAQAALDTPEQQNALRFAAQVHRILKIEGRDESAVGDWEDGAENSVVTVVTSDTPLEQLTVDAAYRGRHDNQKSVLSFAVGIGTDRLHVLDVRDSVANVRAALSEEGISFRTLVDRNGLTRIFVYDANGELTPNITNLSNRYNAEIVTFEGQGESLGAATRDEARRLFDRTIADREGLHFARTTGDRALARGMEYAARRSLSEVSKTEGRSRLTHYSAREGLETIDPAFQGRGVRGQETAQGVPTHRTSSYYFEGTPLEKQVRSVARYAYTVEVPAGSIYDLGADEQGILQEIDDRMTETVVAPAVRVDGEVTTGINHVDAWEKTGRQEEEWDPSKGEDGFVTSTGRFVSREEAAEIAARGSQQLRQTLAEREAELEEGRFLVSEDMDAVKVPPPVSRDAYNDAVLQEIKDRGFLGYANTSHNLPNIVHLFDAHTPIEVRAAGAQDRMYHNFEIPAWEKSGRITKADFEQALRNIQGGTSAFVGLPIPTDSALWRSYVTVGAYFIQQGAATLENFTRSAQEYLGWAYEAIKGQLEEWFKAAQKEARRRARIKDHPISANKYRFEPSRIQEGKVSVSQVAGFLAIDAQMEGELAPDSDERARIDRFKEVAKTEIAYQLTQQMTGADWYADNAFDRNIVALHPELENLQLRALYKIVVALASNGQAPDGNLRIANAMWESYMNTGTFPEYDVDTGQQWSRLHPTSIANLNAVLEEFGVEGLADWLLATHDVAELKPRGSKGQVAGKMGKDFKLGAEIFGPKIGAFYANLMGLTDYATKDRWFTRTWNRYMGTPWHLDKTGKKVKDSVGEWVTQDLPRAGEAAVMDQAMKELSEELGIDVRDAQAILWFYEKQLYTELGSINDEQNFGTESAKILEARGIPVPAGDNGLALPSLLELSEEEGPGGLGSITGTEANTARRKLLRLAREYELREGENEQLNRQTAREALEDLAALSESITQRYAGKEPVSPGFGRPLASDENAGRLVKTLEILGKGFGEPLSGQPLLGKTIARRTDQVVHDLAVLAQAFRDPRHETAHVVWMKMLPLGNVEGTFRIVGHEALSSRLAGSTVALDERAIQQIMAETGTTRELAVPVWIRTRAAKFGADAVAFWHNHPSGSVTPSPADGSMTAAWNHWAGVAGVQFAGSIVINGGKYASIWTRDIPGSDTQFNFTHRVQELSPEKSGGFLQVTSTKRDESGSVVEETKWVDSVLAPSKPMFGAGQDIITFPSSALAESLASGNVQNVILGVHESLAQMAFTAKQQTHLDQANPILFGLGTQGRVNIVGAVPMATLESNFLYMDLAYRLTSEFGVDFIHIVLGNQGLSEQASENLKRLFDLGTATSVINAEGVLLMANPAGFQKQVSHQLKELMGSSQMTQEDLREEGRLISDAVYQRAYTRLLEASTQLSSNPMANLQAWRDALVIGAYHLENGIRDFAQWKDQMIADIGQKLDERFSDSKEDVLTSLWEAVNKIFTYNNQPYATREGLDELERELSTQLYLANRDKVKVDEEKIVGLRKADIEALRIKLGLHELPVPQRMAFERAWRDALEEGEILRVDSSVDAILSSQTPIILQPKEQAAFVGRLAQLENQHEQLLSEMLALQAEGRAKDAVAVGQRVAHVEQAIDNLTQAARRTGTMFGRGLAFQKLLVNRETWSVANLSNVIRMAQSAKGAELTDEERMQFADMVSAVREAREALEAAEKEQERLRKENAVLRANKEVVRRVKETKGRREKLAEEREGLYDELRKLGFRVNEIGGLTTEAAVIVSKLVNNYIQSGIVQLSDIVDEIKGRLGDQVTDSDIIGVIADMSPAAKRKARQQIENEKDAVTKLADLLRQLEQFKKTNYTRLVNEILGQVWRTEVDSSRLETIVRVIYEVKDLAEAGELEGARRRFKDIRKLVQIEERIAKLDEILRDPELLAQEAARRAERDNPPPDAPEVMKAKIDLRLRERDIHNAIERTKPLMGGKLLLALVLMIRTFQATGDLSGLGRQGKFLLTRMPNKIPEIFMQSLKALVSEANATALEISLDEHPNHYTWMKSGLYLASIHETQVTKREEMFASSLSDRMYNTKIPVLRQWGQMIRASNRHMVAVLNLIRVARFESYMESHPLATDEELAAYADFVNVSSGRGKLSPGMAKWLSIVLFAPRFAISRITTPWHLVKNWKIKPVRNEIAKNLLSFVATNLSIMWALSLIDDDDEIEMGTDPRTSDWGKLLIGNTRFDPWGGFLQPYRTANQLILMAKDAWLPEDAPKRKSRRDQWDLFMRFWIYKGSPAITFPVELLFRRDVIGKPTTPVVTILKSVIPLAAQDTIEMVKQGSPTWLVVSGAAAAILGESTSTYHEDQTKKVPIMKLFNKAEFDVPAITNYPEVIKTNRELKATYDQLYRDLLATEVEARMPALKAIEDPEELKEELRGLAEEARNTILERLYEEHEAAIEASEEVLAEEEGTEF